MIIRTCKTLHISHDFTPNRGHFMTFIFSVQSFVLSVLLYVLYVLSFPPILIQISINSLTLNTFCRKLKLFELIVYWSFCMSM